jgi:hypothetical protein
MLVLVGIGILLAITLRLALLSVSCAQIPAFDDECKIALQAKQVAAGERPLLILASPYIFPLDAYLMAPLIKYLPRTAFGARIMATGFGLLAMGFSMLILWRWGGLRDIWPGLVLILFSSPYLLALQHGCAMPAYATLVMITALLILIAQRNGAEGEGQWGAALAVGLLIGLACSETMLCLPALLTVGAMVGLQRGWRSMRVALPALTVGIGIAFLPHYLAKVLHPGAFNAVEHKVSFVAGLSHLVNPVLSMTLPAAFGFGSPLFPDTKERLTWLAGGAGVAGMLWALVLVVATGVALRDFILRWKRERWPSVDGLLLFVGISWLSMILFLFSGRSHSHTFRYFVLIVWGFPFLVGGLYLRAGRSARWVLGGMAIILALLNVGGVMALINRWRDPGIARDLKLYDLTPAVRYLDSRGITKGYGSYTDSYRFNFETDGRLIVCQAYNERFPTWPVPFKPGVDACTNIAFVLSDSYSLPPEQFERDLSFCKIRYRKQLCGEFSVYTDFEWPPEAPRLFSRLPACQIDASHHRMDAMRMHDGKDSFWRCLGFIQKPGMWVSMKWEEPLVVKQVVFDQGVYHRDHPLSVHVDALKKGEWYRVASDVPVIRQPFGFINHHPIYGHGVTTVPLPEPVTTTGIRVEIAKPRANYAWTIVEMGIAGGAPPGKSEGLSQ